MQTQSPAPNGSSFYFLHVSGGEPVDSDAGTQQAVQVEILPGFGVPNNITIHFDTDPTGAGRSVPRQGGVWNVDVPDADPGSSVRIWATWPGFLGTVTTWSDSIEYTGTPPVGFDPCALPQANKGFLNLARSTAGDTLEPNIRTGPEVKLYPTGGLVGTVGETLGCVGTILTSPVTTCLSTVLGQPFATRMTDGMFQTEAGRPGRLTGDCGGGTYSPRGFTDVDAEKLFDIGSPLVDTSKGSALALLANVATGSTPTAAQEGWIRSKAFRCGRLAVMPVLDQTPLLNVAGLQQKITSLTYVWIDDNGSGRGLAWSGNKLRSFRGYVLNPKLLPELVSGSPVVGPYLGPDMPKEAMLIPDLPSP